MPGTPDGGATGLWNIRVNSPGSDDGWDGRSVSVVCRLSPTGGTPGTGAGGAAGLWNIRVNSPGSEDGGDTGRAGGGGGVFPAPGATPGSGVAAGAGGGVPAATGATPGTGDGGATGLWNIRVNSPGSDDEGATGPVAGGGAVPAATGGTPGTPVAGGMDCGVPAEPGATGLWNIRVTPGSDDGRAKWDRRSVSVVCRLPATGGTPGTGVAGGMDCSVPAEPGATGLWNIRVNSPGSDGDGAKWDRRSVSVVCRLPTTGGTPGTGVAGGMDCGVPAETGATGLWNIRVNSPGSDDGCAKWDRRSVSVVCRLPAIGATPGTGVAGGGDCVVPAEPGGTPGTSVGGATGLWNIRVNSPGSDDGATGRVGGGGGVLPAIGATPGTGVGGATGLWNIRVNSPGSDGDGASRDR
jgi:hypothetical protein